MLAILIKPVRDNCGQWHKVGEHVALVSLNVRAEFDTRLLINVAFENGAHVRVPRFLLRSGSE